jgi:hypothetical protein
MNYAHAIAVKNIRNAASIRSDMSDKVIGYICHAIGVVVFSIIMIVISREYQIWRVTREKWHPGYKPKECAS